MHYINMAIVHSVGGRRNFEDKDATLSTYEGSSKHKVLKNVVFKTPTGISEKIKTLGFQNYCLYCVLANKIAAQFFFRSLLCSATDRSTVTRRLQTKRRVKGELGREGEKAIGGSELQLSSRKGGSGGVFLLLSKLILYVLARSYA